MPSLKDTLSNDMKTAMKARDKACLAVIRLILSAIKQKEVDERIELSDEQVVAVLTKMSKQRKDSIEQFEKAERADLAQKEAYELSVIETYLPKQLSETEISDYITKAISESGAESMRDMGKVMGILKPQLQGRADMAQVSQLIKIKLN